MMPIPLANLGIDPSTMKNGLAAPFRPDPDTAAATKFELGGDRFLPAFKAAAVLTEGEPCTAGF
jgi:hypothetical protein